MAYRFTAKQSTKQQQNTYALYMILSSYFNRSTCSNKLQETSLLLYYQELAPARQEALEEKMIADVEKQLQEILPVLGQMNCEVFIRRQADEYKLFFETGFEAVSAAVDRKGHYRIQVLEGADHPLPISA